MTIKSDDSKIKLAKILTACSQNHAVHTAHGVSVLALQPSIKLHSATPAFATMVYSHTVLALVAVLGVVLGAAAKNSNVHLTYHWHMQQPM